MLLVTGGLGFIGSSVVQHYLECGQAVVASGLATDRVPGNLSRHLGKGLTAAVADMANPYAVFDLCRNHAVESIIHLAGPLIGALSPAEEMRQNTAGLLNILEAARLFRMRRVSMASSIAVYFGLPEGPFNEELTVRLEASHTIEAYKKAEELMGLYYAEQTGVDLIALRLASIYGPRYRSRRHLPAQLVHAAVRSLPRAALLPDTLPPYHADDGATDLCYVKDCADGIQRVHESTALRHKSYNIGGGLDVSNQYFKDAAEALFGPVDYPLEPGRSPRHWPHAVLRLDRIHADTGYAPRFDAESAMRDYAEWLRTGEEF